MLHDARFDSPEIEDAAAMREALVFYDSRRTSIYAHTLSAAARSPEWTRIASLFSAEMRDQGYQLRARAVFQNEWEPFLTHLQEWGESYANAGVSYAAWLDVIRVHRDSMIDELTARLAENPGSLAQTRVIARGINALCDLSVTCIGDAYLKALVARPEERYRDLFEKSPLPMWMFERDTLRFVMVNDAAVKHCGYSREELATMTLADIRPPEDLPELRAHLAQVTGLLAERTVWRHRRKNGEIAFVAIRANDFVSHGRSVRLAVIDDVTDRMRAEETLRATEEQLRHAQKTEAIGRLAGGVAHDFNNILQVVQSYASLLEGSLEPSDPRHEDAAEIRRASERASGITRQLLALSRHGIAAPRPLDLNQIVVGFVPMLQRLVGETVAIATRPGVVPSVICDPGQIEQVLMNLAVNARDAMVDGGRLTIETRTIEVEASGSLGPPAGSYVELAFTDTGCGMDAETQRRIFDPFFTTKEEGKGTGLGLSIVHGIVTQAGGSISVYSEPAQGSTFRVLLPVARTEIVASQEVSNPIAPASLPPMRILVIDDQREVRTVASRLLREAGCQVVEAESAEEARQICVRDHEVIDLVLVDVVLPDSRGDALVRQLRELRPALRFVQMSGYPAGSTGAAPESYLAKPFSAAELRGAVARASGLSGISTGAPAIAPSATTRRALVADDDAAMRKAIARLLTRAGFAVVEVESGFQAIAALKSRSFDVIVSDVQMPDGGGLDLLRAVRGIDLDIPVILVTGEPSIAAATAAVEYGAFRYLTKPLDTADFVKSVEHAARAHALARLRREAYSVNGTQSGAIDRAGLEVRFDKALESLWMAFQPIVHAATGALFGIEALVRSGEPSIPNPLALLDAATQLGRLPVLGRKVRALSSAGFSSRTDDTVLFVNLHPDDLYDIDLVDEASPLSKIASRVILEVTERASLDSSAALAERIATLRRLGFRLAVDDIGAGYSGLTSFTQLMPEVVKIDMSLVRDVHKSVLKQRTIGALCRLCREFGTLVVGEGVETPDERETLLALGCDLLQGYLLGRPSRDLP